MYIYLDIEKNSLTVLDITWDIILDRIVFYLTEEIKHEIFKRAANYIEESIQILFMIETSI